MKRLDSMSTLLRKSGWVALCLVAASIGAPAHAADDIPRDVVVDVRVFEARSVQPDFQAMGELAFFIDTDGVAVTEAQWLGTIARYASDSFLATLAFETIGLEDSSFRFELVKRSRQFELSADLSGFVAPGVFTPTVSGALSRGGELQRSFEQTIELRLGQTFVWSSMDLELSASEYLSHFRDYTDSDDRRTLYDKLRNYSTFLVLAVSLRSTGDAPATEAVALGLPDDVVIPVFESPMGIDIVGTVELELELDSAGAPTGVRIVRSSIPEVNSRILGEAETWRFPDAPGNKGRIKLDLKAAP